MGGSRQAALPTRRPVTSRVTDLRSASVLSRQIRVDCTASRSSAEVPDVETRERRRPVERLGDAGFLFEILLPQLVHEASDLAGQRRLDAGQAGADDRELAFGLGEIDIGVEAAAPQRVGELARAVGGQDDVRDRPRARIVPSSGMVIWKSERTSRR